MALSAEQRQEFALVAFMRRKINDRYDELKAAYGPMLERGDKVSGRLLDADGEPFGDSIGSMYKTDPKTKPRVGTPCRQCGIDTSTPAYVAWVKERAPRQVIEVVRPEYTKLVLADPNLHQAGEHTVSGDGEMIPGVLWSADAPYVAAAPVTKAQEATIVQALNNGQLNMAQVAARAIFEIGNEIVEDDGGEFRKELVAELGPAMQEGESDAQEAGVHAPDQRPA